jgi:outer membrane protein TolC
LLNVSWVSAVVVLGLAGASGASPGDATVHVDPGPLLTLDEALRIALSDNERLGAASAAREAAEADVGAAKSGRLPRLDFDETFSWTTNPTLVFSNLLGQENFTAADFALDNLNTPDPLTNWNSVLSFSYPIYTGGQVAGGLDAARAGLDAADAGLERTRQEVARDVVDAFSAAVLARAHLDVARESLETARANVAMVTDLRDAGLVVESDLLQARVREIEVEEMVIRAEAGVEVARAAVNLQLGRDLDTPFSLDPTLEADDGPERPLKELVAEAIANRPDLRAADARVRAASESGRTARSGTKPEVGFQGRFEANDEDFIGAQGTNWSVLVAAKIPIYQGKQSRARVARAEARTREAQRMRDLLRQSIDLETRRAFYDVRASRKSLEQSRRAVDLARESLRSVQDRYREGLTTLVELLDAETALTRSRTREIATLRELIVSQANLELAVGRL